MPNANAIGEALTNYSLKNAINAIKSIKKDGGTVSDGGFKFERLTKEDLARVSFPGMSGADAKAFKAELIAAATPKADRADIAYNANKNEALANPGAAMGGTGVKASDYDQENDVIVGLLLKKAVSFSQATPPKEFTVTFPQEMTTDDGKKAIHIVEFAISPKTALQATSEYVQESFSYAPRLAKVLVGMSPADTQTFYDVLALGCDVLTAASFVAAVPHLAQGLPLLLV